MPTIAFSKIPDLDEFLDGVKLDTAINKIMLEGHRDVIKAIDEKLSRTRKAVWGNAERGIYLEERVKALEDRTSKFNKEEEEMRSTMDLMLEGLDDIDDLLWSQSRQISNLKKKNKNLKKKTKKRRN